MPEFFGPADRTPMKKRNSLKAIYKNKCRTISTAAVMFFTGLCAVLWKTKYTLIVKTGIKTASSSHEWLIIGVSASIKPVVWAF